MLDRRRGVLAAFVVAGACAIGAYSLDKDKPAEPSTKGVAGRFVAVEAGGPAANVPGPRIGEDGPKPSAFSRAARAGDAPLAEMPELAKKVRRIATTRTAGVDHAVFVGNDLSGRTCVILQEGPLGRGGGGCNPSRDPFHGSTVMWSSTHYNEDPQKLVIFGVVSDRVHAMGFTFDGGTQTAVPVSEDGGFIYVVAEPVIDPIDVPDEIITFGSNGGEIERTKLGITFGP
jgi:hypothetical protein